MDPNARPLEEAQRQLSLMLQQQEELAPALYHDLALYLQVLRDGLLPAVQQACFHLATQVVPERYQRLPEQRRQQFQFRLASLVQRCSTLLTVEQVMGLAAQQQRREQRRSTLERQRLLQAFLEGDAESGGPAAAFGALEPDRRSPGPSPADAAPPSPQSIHLSLDLPVSADRFDHGIPGLPRPAASDRRSASSPAPAPASAATDQPEEARRRSEAELALLQSLFQMASEGLDHEDAPRADDHRDAAPRADAPRADRRAPDLGSTDLTTAERPLQDRRAQPSPPAAGAAGAPPDPAVTGAALPRDPLLQLRWWTHFDRALSRRLRNLSHALNVEMMRLGLAQGLLPLNLLDAVLEGQVDALPAPANLLRLPLPLPGGASSGSEVLTLLLRTADLDYEQPRLRTCRRRLEQRRRALRTMAKRYRVWQRRVTALEAEQQWFRDSAQLQNQPLPPAP